VVFKKTGTLFDSPRGHMNLFATYESEVTELVSNAKSVIASVEEGTVSSAEGARKVRDALAECEENVVGMDMAQRNAPGK
jgi:hypothetical protein